MSKISERYIIYLTGKSEKFDSLQKTLELIYPSTKKSSLGMHCTLFPFYSKTTEDILIKEFFNTNFQTILTKVKDISLFDNESIVLKLLKTTALENCHCEYMSKFVKYEYIFEESLYKGYIGASYNPHLTLGHVAGITSIENLPNNFNVKGENIVLDKIVLARRLEPEHKWQTLVERY